MSTSNLIYIHEKQTTNNNEYVDKDKKDTMIEENNTYNKMRLGITIHEIDTKWGKNIIF